MTMKQAKLDKIDKHTKEGKAMLENLTKTHTVAARKRRQGDASLLKRVKRVFK